MIPQLPNIRVCVRCHLEPPLTCRSFFLCDALQVRFGYSKADVESLVNATTKPNFGGVDIFLPSQWPTSICRGTVPLPGSVRAL